jgi:hypothetical protein
MVLPKIGVYLPKLSTFLAPNQQLEYKISGIFHRYLLIRVHQYFLMGLMSLSGSSGVRASCRRDGHTPRMKTREKIDKSPYSSAIILR